MPIIKICTQIEAKKELVFDLSRSIELHKVSTAHTNETAVAGKTSGLMELHDSVTWRAKHFGVYQRLTSKITAYDRPDFFTDEMVSGAFKCFKHAHHFSDMDGGTLMVDIFEYQSPLGIFGRAVDWLFLKKYMTRLLENRNRVIKNFAEEKQALT